MNRQSTGISELDALLGGGLLPGTLTVVLGATGIGKTQLGIQYCHAGNASANENQFGAILDMCSRGDSQSHATYAERMFQWRLNTFEPSTATPNAIFDQQLAWPHYMHAWDYSGRQILRHEVDSETWRAWQAELNRRLDAVTAYFYGHFLRGTKRVVIDGMEPVDSPHESVQFQLFETIYHRMIRKDAEWLARDVLREKYRAFQESVEQSRYDHSQIGCLLLLTTHEAMLDELIARPLDEGDVLSNANTIICMGKQREGNRLARAIYVAKHRGSACSDEIVRFTIEESGLRF